MATGKPSERSSRADRSAAGLRLFFGLLALLAMGWQLSLHVRLGFSLLNFFSFFTNLSNLFAAAVLLRLAARGWRGRQTPADDRLRAAATVAMAVVGLVFAVLLRDVELGALRPWVNTVLHELMPLVLLLDWLLWPPRQRLSARQLLPLLGLPALYLAYVLLRGAGIGWYPYSFLDPARVGGYGVVALYAAGIAVSFLCIGGLVLMLGNRRAGAAPQRAG